MSTSSTNNNTILDEDLKILKKRAIEKTIATIIDSEVHRHRWEKAIEIESRWWIDGDK